VHDIICYKQITSNGETEFTTQCNDVIRKIHELSMVKLIQNPVRYSNTMD